MSTPSTATITVPPNHHHYYHQQPPYLPPMGDYHGVNYAAAAPSAPKQQYAQHGANGYTNGNGNGSNNAVPADVRRPAPSQQKSQIYDNSHAHAGAPMTYQHETPAASSVATSRNAHTHNSSSSSNRKRVREEPVDWEAYFGGKPPKEIIVIDDDEPNTQSPTVAHGVADPSHSSHHASTNYAASAASAPHHADKRRRVAAAAAAAAAPAAPHYDPVYQQPSYSNTPYYDDSSAKYTGSTDRTAPYHNNNNNTTTATATATTAPGSLASSNGAYLEEGTVGQKRKRSTRQTAAADQKKREVAAHPDPFLEYVPPPKPPIKAKDVFVPQIPERPSSRRDKVDDDDGHYIVVENADITDRYSIIRLLGQGTFGKVVQAWDRKRQSEVAIKIIRSVQKYRDASRIELRVLSTLASNDKHNRNKCIHLRDTFDFRNHICIVTDLLGQSVFDFLKSNQFVPFPSSHIQKFARQLFTSVAFLHDLNLIHTDLKPENILLVNSSYQTFTYNRSVPSSSNTTSRSAKFRRVLLDPEIRLIDFGSATFEDEYHSSVVSTRHYRAPEIILNLGWSFPCDIWSIGCILVEFYTGDALFQTHDNLEHLAMMEAVCDGPLDKHLIRAVTSARGSNKNAAAQYFKRQNLDYPQQDTPRSSRKFVKAMKRLHETIPPHTEFTRKFLDLLRKIFVYDPKKRITAHQALQHPWFKEHFEDDGTEAEKIRLERERVERLKRTTHPVR